MANYIFNATCDLTDLRKCQVGVNFMDPCNCLNYYQCTNQYTMKTLNCNLGTLWDYTLGTCNHHIDVEVKQNCSRLNSWTRCNTTANRLEELKSLCTGVSATPPPNVTAKPPDSEQPSESTLNAGMIAGLIIAGAVITLAVIALYVLYTRRKRAKEDKLKRRTTIENREYFENGQLEDPYAIIDDRMVNRGINQNNNIIGGSGNGTISTTSTLPGEGETMAVYDNSAFREEGGYTSTLERSPVSPYDTLSGSARPYEKAKNNSNDDVVGASGGDVIEAGSSGVNASEGSVTTEVVGDVGVKADGNKELNTRANDDMESPDYYKLEPES